jgi:hypothetical protein
MGENSAETPNEPDSASDEETFARLGADLADGVMASVGGWIENCLARFGLTVSPAELEDATGQALAIIETPLRALLRADIDQQRGTPLTIIRQAVVVPTAVLRALGVEPASRDPFDAQQFPDDIYALSPANFAELHETLQETGLRWSVAKAYLHRQRHQPRVD